MKKLYFKNIVKIFFEEGEKRLVAKMSKKSKDLKPFKINKFLLLMGLLLTFFLVPTGLNIISNVRASGTDYDYMFTEDIFYNETDPVYDESFNIRNQQEFTGDYNATYSFKDGFPLGWVNSSSGNTSLSIVDVDNHDDVLQFYDNDLSFSSTCTFDFFSVVGNLVFEFWYRFNSDQATAEYLRLIFKEGGDVKLDFSFNYNAIGRLTINDGIGGWTTITSINVDMWYHIKVICDDATDTLDFYLNSFFIGNFAYTDDVITNLESISCYTRGSGGGLDYYHWLDAIGLTSDSFYNINDNVIPLINELETNEVDRWEFALASPDVLNAVDSDNPNGWDDYEESGDNVNINADGLNDNTVRMFSGTYDNGIEKDDFFEENGSIVEVKWLFKYTENPTLMNGNTTLKVFSNDSTEICRINVRSIPLYENFIQYFDGSNFVNLTTPNNWLYHYVYYDFYLYINYYDDVAFLSYENSTDYQSWCFPLIESGKAGISKVSFVNFQEGVALNLPMNLDSIGVYLDSVSLSDENAWKSIDIGSNWDIENHNLLYSDFDGFGMINYTDGIYEVGVTTLESLYDWCFLGTIDNVQNLYHLYGGLVSNPYLILYQVNYYDDPYIGWMDLRNFQVNYLNITGVLLNDIFLTMTYQSDNPEDNYFYVEDTYLRYTLTCIDSDLEYISANFDIDDFPTNEYAIGFSVDIVGSPLLFCSGVLYLNFGDATSYGYYFDSNDVFSEIMSQSKVISNITITISDNDVDGASGNIVSGYVSSLEFIYYPNVETTLTMIGLLAMIGPLLALFIPALLLYSKYGKRVFMPVLLLMSIVCVVTSLIPYWLFFLMMIFFGVYFFYSYKKGEII